MNSGSSNAKRRDARPRMLEGVRKMWMKTSVVWGIAVASTVITLVALYIFFTSNADGEQATATIMDSGFYDSKGMKNIMNPSSKPLTMRAMNEKTCYHPQCIDACNDVCQKKNVPVIPPEMHISSTTRRRGSVYYDSHQLICVFRAARYNLWPKKLQCSAYVYLRELWPGFDNWPVQSYRADMPLLKADHFFNRARVKYPHALWYIGYEGGLQNDAVSGIDARSYAGTIATQVKQPRISEYLNMSDFYGIAFINMPVGSEEVLQTVELFATALQQQLPSKWFILYSMLLSENIIHNPGFIAKVQKFASFPQTFIGIHINKMYLYYKVIKNEFPSFTARDTLQANIDGIKKIWEAFPLERLVCVSISGILYYYDRLNNPRGRNPYLHLQPVPRLHLTAELDHKGRPYDSVIRWPRSEKYEEEFVYGEIGNADCIVYDTASSMLEKVNDVLRMLYTGHDELRHMCVVFDDIGEDSLDVNVTFGNASYKWKPYELLTSVVSAMENKSGHTIWPKSFYDSN